MRCSIISNKQEFRVKLGTPTISALYLIDNCVSKKVVQLGNYSSQDICLCKKGYKGQKCDKTKKKKEVIKRQIKRPQETHGQNDISNRIRNVISLATRQKFLVARKLESSAGLRQLFTRIFHMHCVRLWIWCLYMKAIFRYRTRAIITRGFYYFSFYSMSGFLWWLAGFFEKVRLLIKSG